MKQFSMVSIAKRNQLVLSQINWSSIALAMIFILSINIEACKQDCDNNFVKKYSTSTGDFYQSDTLVLSLSHPDASSGELSCFAFKNLKDEIKLTFISSSDYSHFSFGNSDTTMVIIYGSVPKDTLIKYFASGDKKSGEKFNATASFRMADALAADIVANKKNNQINFMLGTYKFVLSDEMYCMLKQMSNSKL